MVTQRRQAPVSGVLLVDTSSEPARALSHVLDGHGIEHIEVARWPELLEQVVVRAPQVVVVDLAMAGAAGTRLVGMVRVAGPQARIAVLSELDVLDVAALEGGATMVMTPRDLRAFGLMVRQMAASAGLVTGAGEGGSRGRLSTKAPS